MPEKNDDGKKDRGKVGKPVVTLPAIAEKEIEWMIPGEISVNDDGTHNILLVCQHGAPGDDDNTEILTALLAKELECFAVVNNRKYNRNEEKSPQTYPQDLNIPEQARSPQCKDFWDPLIDRLKHIIRWYTKPPLVLFIHGMGDDYADEYVGEAYNVALGLGQIGDYDPKTATMSEKLFKSFKKLLTKKLGPTKEGVERYAAVGRVPPVLKDEVPGHAVEAVQVEIRYTGFRDPENINRTVERLKAVMLDKEIAEFVTKDLRENPLSMEELEPFPEVSSDANSTSRSPRVEEPMREPGEAHQITIDREFANLIHDLSPDEFQQLQRNILRDGCIEPLSVWEHDGKLFLLDGHHRFKVCKEHSKPFQIVRIELADRAEAVLWIVDKQTGRRTLCKFETIELLQPYHDALRRESKRRQEEAYKQRGEESSTLEPLHVDEVVAQKAGVSPRLYSMARSIIANGSQELKEQLRKEDLTITAAYQTLQEPKKEKSKKKDIQVKPQPAHADENDPDAQLALPPPSDVIVINNAWGDSSINVGRLAQLPVSKMAADNCILWVWTPVKHLRKVFPIVDEWGFQFQTILTWIKPEPVEEELLGEVTEFCVVATKGTPSINREYRFHNAISAVVRHGTQEPHGFFTMVDNKFPGTARLEIFAESPREGWTSWPPIVARAIAPEGEGSADTPHETKHSKPSREGKKGSRRQKKELKKPKDTDGAGQ
jgi:N6-adenosine-specific RNA methylase IME4